MTKRDESKTRDPNINESDEAKHMTAIEADMQQTRSAISGDLRTLGARLSPEQLKENAKEVVAEAKNAAVDTLHEARDAATGAFRDAKDSAMESVSAKVDEIKGDVRRAQRETWGFLRENAMPIALIGIGLAMFRAQRRSREARWDHEYRWGAAGDAARGYREPDWATPETGGSKAKQLAKQANDQTREWTHGAGEKLGDAAGQVRDFAQRELESAGRVIRDTERKVGDAVGQARDFAGRELREAREYSAHVFEAHPLAAGAALVALGIGAGLALPATRREGELMGKERDRVMSGARHIIDDIGHAAVDAKRDFKDALTGPRPSPTA